MMKLPKKLPGPVTRRCRLAPVGSANARHQNCGEIDWDTKTVSLQAFTLIESLVVVATIAILAAVIFPVMNRTKHGAVAAACLKNQKQLAAAWSLYANDNREALVNFDTIRNAAGDTPWCYITPNPFPIPPGTDANTAARLRLQTGYTQGALFLYARDTTIVHCPADSRSENAPAANPTSSRSNYAYGSYSGAGGMNGFIFAPDTALKQRSSILHPSGRYLWVEENDSRGESLSSWNMHPGTPPQFVGAIFVDSVAAWHGKNSTLSWADGHVENHRWEEKATVTYALNMDTNKYFSPPLTTRQCPQDLNFLASGYATKRNP